MANSWAHLCTWRTAQSSSSLTDPPYTFPSLPSPVFLAAQRRCRRPRGGGCVYDAAFALQRQNLSEFAGDESASFIISSFIRMRREPGVRGGSGK